jgi:hypothetical protein
LALQDTSRELIVKKEETIANREERRRKEKEATSKSFVDLHMRSLEVEDANAKSRLLKAKAKAKLMGVDAKSRLLQVEAKVIAEENRINLTDLDTASSRTKGLDREEGNQS